MQTLQALRERAKSKLITKKDFPIQISPLYPFKKNKDIIYKDDTHTYTSIVTGEVQTSVTSFLGLLKDKQTVYPTESTQLRLGFTKQEVYKYWKQKNHWAKGRGSFIHNWIEKEITVGLVSFISYREIEKLVKELNEDFFIYINFARNRVRGKNYHVEALLNCLKLKIAGQADLIVDIDSNSFYVEDWKTNEKDLEEDNSYGKDILDNFPATTLNEYILQLSIYSYLYALMTGKVCKGLHIHHFRNSEVKTYSYDYNPLLIEQLWQRKLKLGLK